MISFMPDEPTALLHAAAPDLLAAMTHGSLGVIATDIRMLLARWDEYSPEHIRGELRDLLSEIIEPQLSRESAAISAATGGKGAG